MLLNRKLLGNGKFRLKLYGAGEAAAEYVVEVE